MNEMKEKQNSPYVNVRIVYYVTIGEGSGNICIKESDIITIKYCKDSAVFTLFLNTARKVGEKLSSEF